ncbi:hypothetical protein GJ744_010907 [Endocarpon pusillum]|uniref:Uncharacterized protein n=1 Tax=Endocarpon pusillum TaxID=364733 RepID=A0A8H7AGN9_9EURO|nr:hypothetical protein GJ744_010907 [Endocarpon pusillum]
MGCMLSQGSLSDSSITGPLRLSDVSISNSDVPTSNFKASGAQGAMTQFKSCTFESWITITTRQRLAWNLSSQIRRRRLIRTSWALLPFLGNEAALSTASRIIVGRAPMNLTSLQCTLLTMRHNSQPSHEGRLLELPRMFSTSKSSQ